MNVRTVTIGVAGLDAVAWALVALATFLSGSDPATKGLDRAAGLLVTALFAVTGVPALVLAARGRAPRAALALAIAFPAVLGLLVVSAIVAFAGGRAAA